MPRDVVHKWGVRKNWSTLLKMEINEDTCCLGKSRVYKGRLIIRSRPFSIILKVLINHPYAREIRISVRIRPRLCYCWLKFTFNLTRSS